MKHLFLALCVMTATVACGEEVVSAVDSVQMNQEPLLITDEITVTEAHLRGNLHGYKVDDPVNIVSGITSDELSQISLIHENEDRAVMGLISLPMLVGASVGEVDLDGSSGLGCSGWEAYSWNEDTYTTTIRANVNERMGGGYELDYQLDFDSGDQLEGTITYHLNE